ncbi:hypothetical protein CTAYLR_006817 [Chrysophaeum taylorii]|uniref:Phosphatidylinositol-3-phosphatase n=1 Tax=Chrysophaeum taylorii TaxID=2483200 RepID=A0AAD7XHK8_9STRA|nr:hypothetical protein CTAYLR_006817 [Chrysophaeum taylorii]
MLQARLLHLRRKGGEATLFKDECSSDFLAAHREYSFVKVGVTEALLKLDKVGTMAAALKEWFEVAVGALEDLCGVECVEARVGRELCRECRAAQAAVAALVEACAGAASDLCRPLRETVEAEFAAVSNAKDALYEALVAKRGARARSEIAGTRHYERYADAAAVEEDRVIATMDRAATVAAQRIGRGLREMVEREASHAAQASTCLERAARLVERDDDAAETDDDESSSNGGAAAADDDDDLESDAGGGHQCFSELATERRKVVERYGGQLSAAQLSQLCREAGLGDDRGRSKPEPRLLASGETLVAPVVDDALFLHAARPSTPGRVMVTSRRVVFTPYLPTSRPRASTAPAPPARDVLAAARRLAGFSVPVDAVDVDELRRDETKQNAATILDVAARDGSTFALAFGRARMVALSDDVATFEAAARSPADVVRIALLEACAAVGVGGHRHRTVDHQPRAVAEDYERFGLGFFWRATLANQTYGLCDTYPASLVVPKVMVDAEIESSAGYRSRRRLVALSWRNARLAAPGEIVLLRAAQPLSGVQKATNADDEALLRNVARARPIKFGGPKLRIFDARPFANAAANTLAGKGVEDVKAYARDDVDVDLTYLGIENIHVVRAAYAGLRRAIEASYLSTLASRQPATPGSSPSPAAAGSRRRSSTTPVSAPAASNSGDDAKTPDHACFDFDEEAARAILWATGKKRRALGGAKKTWLDHVSSVLRGAVEVARCLVDDRASALVHCSDGWDRTSQLTSLAMLVVDDHYRTLRGFATLVEKEWCSFGHMFAKRNGGSAGKKQTSPIFLQFLDAVYQIWFQLPPAFEFDASLLDVLAERSYATATFSTFSGNSEFDRCGLNLPDVWTDLLADPQKYKNPLYEPRGCGATLHPLATASKLRVWPAHARRWALAVDQQQRRRNSTSLAAVSADANVLQSLRSSRRSFDATPSPLPPKPPRQPPRPPPPLQPPPTSPRPDSPQTSPARSIPRQQPPPPPPPTTRPSFDSDDATTTTTTTDSDPPPMPANNALDPPPMQNRRSFRSDATDVGAGGGQSPKPANKAAVVPPPMPHRWSFKADTTDVGASGGQPPKSTDNAVDPPPMPHRRSFRSDTTDVGAAAGQSPKPANKAVFPSPMPHHRWSFRSDTSDVGASGGQSPKPAANKAVVPPPMPNRRSFKADTTDVGASGGQSPKPAANKAVAPPPMPNRRSFRSDTTDVGASDGQPRKSPDNAVVPPPMPHRRSFKADTADVGAGGGQSPKPTDNALHKPPPPPPPMPQCRSFVADNTDPGGGVGSPHPKPANNTLQKPPPPPPPRCRRDTPGSPGAKVYGSLPRPEYPYEVLLSPGPFPDDVNDTERELYLSDHQFKSLLGCTKVEWAKVPRWKRDAKKKELDLF